VLPDAPTDQVADAVVADGGGGVAVSDTDGGATVVVLTGVSGGGAVCVGAVDVGAGGGGAGAALDDVGAADVVREADDGLVDIDDDRVAEAVDLVPDGARYWPDTGPQNALCGRTWRRARGAAGSSALQPCAACANASERPCEPASFGWIPSPDIHSGCAATSSDHRRMRTLLRPDVARSRAAFMAVCESPMRSGRTTSAQITQRRGPRESRMRRADSSKTLATGSFVPELMITIGGTPPTASSFFSVAGVERPTSAW